MDKPFLCYKSLHLSVWLARLRPKDPSSVTPLHQAWVHIWRLFPLFSFTQTSFPPPPLKGATFAAKGTWTCESWGNRTLEKHAPYRQEAGVSGTQGSQDSPHGASESCPTRDLVKPHPTSSCSSTGSVLPQHLGLGYTKLLVGEEGAKESLLPCP